MGVGNLNVSCSADTNPAVGNIGKLGGSVRTMAADVRAAGPAFAQLESQINRAGNTAAEFEKKFARAKAAAAAPRIGGSDVDLSADVNRYAALGSAAGKAVEPMKALKGVMSTVAFAGRMMGWAAVVADLAKVGAEAYKTKDAFERLDLVRGGLGIAGPNVGSIAKEGMAPVIAAAQEKKAADDKKMEEQRRKDQEFAAAQSAARRPGLIAKYGEEEIQRRDDAKKFGDERAAKLADDRAESASREAAAAAQRQKVEQQIEALRERDRKAMQQREAAEKAARDNRMTDEKTVNQLRNRVADYWKTDREREEKNTLRDIEDPRLKQQAQFAFKQLRAADQVKAEHKARDNNPALSLAESGSRESYIQRAAMARESKGEKHQQEMVVVLRKIHDKMDKGKSLPPANI